MFKKNVTFKDYEGQQRSIDLYFNLSKAEIAEMEMNESKMAADGGITGGLQDKLDQITKGGSGAEILKAFKDIVFMAYGRKEHDPDMGTIFNKSAELSKRFENSAAYPEFFMWLIDSEDNAAIFVNEALPADFRVDRDPDKPSAARRPQAPAQRAQVSPAEPERPDQNVTGSPTEIAQTTPEIVVNNTVQGRQPTPEEIAHFLSQNPNGMTGPIAQ